MFRKIEDEITILTSHILELQGEGMTAREKYIARCSFFLGRCAKEMEVTKNRKLFEGKDMDE